MHQLYCNCLFGILVHLSLSLTVIQIHATQLYHASFMGNIDEVKELLEEGVNVNEPNDVCKIDTIKMDEYLSPSKLSIMSWISI